MSGGGDLLGWLRLAPRVDPSTDATRLGLDARAGFVLSRIDGHTEAGMLCELVAMPPEEIVVVLARLEAAGAIVWRGHGASSTPPDPTLEARLNEPGDLSRAEKLRILAALRDVEERSLWEILGLRGEPTAADVKRAFFSLSKQFHPDRFFHRDLGPYADRVKRVFQGIKHAYDVLSDAEKNAAYRVQHPPPAALGELRLPVRRRPSSGVEAEPRPEPVDVVAKARLEERRQQILEERRAKQKHPQADQHKRAAELYQLGLQQMRAGDVVAAANSLKLAITYGPGNADYQRAYDEAHDAAVVVSTKELMAKVDVELSSGHALGAAKLLAEASDLVPDSVQYALRAATQFLAVDDAAKARRYADRALRAGPRRKEVRVLLAEMLEQQGDVAGAIAHLEIAASLDRSDAHVKKTLKRLTKHSG